MPDEQGGELLEWNDQNLYAVISEIYTRAVQDQAFHDRLAASPEEVLGERIKIPDYFKGSFHARKKFTSMFILHLPAFVGAGTTGTTEAPAVEYQLICTTPPPPW